MKCIMSSFGWYISWFFNCLYVYIVCYVSWSRLLLFLSNFLVLTWCFSLSLSLLWLPCSSEYILFYATNGILCVPAVRNMMMLKMINGVVIKHRKDIDPSQKSKHWLRMFDRMWFNYGHLILAHNFDLHKERRRKMNLMNPNTVIEQKNVGKIKIQIMTILPLN